MPMEELFLSASKAWGMKHVYRSDFERNFYSLFYGEILENSLCEIKPHTDSST